MNKTTTKYGRSGIYDMAGDSGQMRATYVFNERLGNNYNDGFQYESNSDHTNWLDGWNSTEEPTIFRTTSTIPINEPLSDYRPEESFSQDYTANGYTSPWRKILLDPMKADYFLSKPLPRVTLRASYKPTDQFGAVKESKEKHEIQRESLTSRTVCFIIAGLLLIFAVSIPVIVISTLSKHDDDSKLYVTAKMSLNINSRYTSALNNTSSTEYKNFGDRFCYEIEKVYRDGTSIGEYYGCKIDSLRDGSILVTFIIYFTETTEETVNSKAYSTLNSYIQANSFGTFLIVPGSIKVIAFSALSLAVPPEVQRPAAPTALTTNEISKYTSTQTTTDVNITTVDLTNINIETTTKMTTNVEISTTTEKPTALTKTTENKVSSEISTAEKKHMESTTGITAQQISTEEKSPTTDTTINKLVSKSKESDISTTTKMSTTKEKSTSTEPVPSASTTEEFNISTKMFLTSTKIASTDSSVTVTSELRTTADSTNISTASKMLSTTDDKTTSRKPTTKEIIATTTTENQDTTENIQTESHDTQTTTSQIQTTTTDKQYIITTKQLIITDTQNSTTEMNTTSTEIRPTTNDLIDTTTDMETTKLETPTTTSATKTADKAATTTEIQIPSTIITNTNVSTATFVQTTTAISISTNIHTNIEQTTEVLSTVDILKATEKVPSTDALSSTDILQNTTDVPSTTDILQTTTEVPSTTDILQNTTEVPSTTDILQSTTEIPSTTYIIQSTAELPSTSDILQNETEVTSTADIIQNTTEILSTDVIQNTTEVPSRTNIIKTTTGLSTSKQIEMTTTVGRSEVSCDDVIAELFSGPINITCLVVSSYDVFEIAVIRGNYSSPQFVTNLHSNGSILRQNNPYPNIDISWDTRSVLTISFGNITCNLNGTYDVLLIDTNKDVIASTSADVLVTNQPGKPVLTLDADQVIGLAFDDGVFYRAENVHKCTGDVGHPPGELLIQIRHSGSANFTALTDSQMKIISRDVTTGTCFNTQSLTFAVNFTQEMDGGKLKCLVPGSLVDGVVSEELKLIPRNICSCAPNESYLKHPKRCDVEVFCLEDRGVMYPTGQACPTNVCVNNNTGKCDPNVNCAEQICNSPGSTYPCSTPSPSTTTLSPSVYISCNDSSVLENSGPVDIVCVFNGSFIFNVGNITFRNVSSTDPYLIGQIQNSSAVDTNTSDKISFMFSSDILSITIENASCSTNGYYGISLELVGGNIEKAEGKLTILNKPKGTANLKLHADQIAEIGGYRGWLLHECKANVGYPAGEIHFEILQPGDTKFSILNVTYEDDSNTYNAEVCSISRTIHFGINFTTNMDKAVIRCVVSHQMFPEVVVYSNNETVSLIPKDLCKTVSGRRILIPHPTNCEDYVECSNGTTYGLSCGTPNTCFGIQQSDACDYCSSVICPADITTESTQETTTAPVSHYISCTEASGLLNSGPVNMTCYLNVSTSSSLNITINTPDSTVVANILHDGSPTQLDSRFSVELRSDTLSITVLNITCSLAGYYTVSVDIGGTVEISRALLSILTKPDRPLITENHATIEGEDTWVATCSGKTGNPAGEIQVLFKRQNDSDFSVRYEHYVQRKKMADVGCNNNETVTVKGPLTSELNNTLIKCISVNSEALDEDENVGLYSSDEGRIILIEENYCRTNESYKFHPRGCSFYIQCGVATGTIYSWNNCGESIPCFNFNRNYCDRCENVAPPCSNFTIS